MIVVWLRKCHCSTKEAYCVANVNEWKFRLARGILPMTLVDDPLAGPPPGLQKASRDPFRIVSAFPSPVRLLLFLGNGGGIDTDRL